jgi:hypothetical protein
MIEKVTQALNALLPTGIHLTLESVQKILENQDFRLSRIYAIQSDQLVLYVGKTTMTLRKRSFQHRAPHNKASTRHIPKDQAWIMKELEICNQKNIRERESYWINKLKPLYNEYQIK